MRLLLLPAAALSAAALTSCGGDDASPAPPPVRLAVTTPHDQAVVPARRVELRGTVRPSTASVTVGGKRAAVSGGTFRASVALAPGTNVIDVLARAGRARPALTAIRVRREVSVRVPDVTGLPVDDARIRITALGLEVDVQEDGGILDRLLPGDPRVCATEPRAGGRLDSGASVSLLVARRC
jgi:hypothetical protein